MEIYFDSVRGTKGYAGYGEYCDPSHYWGKRLGIPELFETYDKVLGNRHAEYQERISYARNNDADFRDKLYDELIEAYPELKSIPINDDRGKYHVVFGCISKFNYHDIHYFVTVPVQQRCYFGLTARREALQHAVGDYHFEWVLSAYSIELMEQKLFKRAA